MEINWLLWPSGLSYHVTKSSRDRRLGPKFESPLGFTIFIIKNWTLTPIADTLRRSAAQGKKWWRLQAPRLSEAVSLS